MKHECNEFNSLVYLLQTLKYLEKGEKEMINKACIDNVEHYRILDAGAGDIAIIATTKCGEKYHFENVVEYDIDKVPDLSLGGYHMNISIAYLDDQMRHSLKTTINPLPIKNVIFNDPATIVFWNDNTKTVVQCSDGDAFDPEKGLAMAIAKKFLGNNGRYFNEIKKWTEPYYDKKIDDDVSRFMEFVKEVVIEEKENEKN